MDVCALFNIEMGSFDQNLQPELLSSNRHEVLMLILYTLYFLYKYLHIQLNIFLNCFCPTAGRVDYRLS